MVADTVPPLKRTTVDGLSERIGASSVAELMSAVRCTTPEKPSLLTVRVKVPEEPTWTVRELGATVKLNPVTVSVVAAE